MSTATMAEAAAAATPSQVPQMALLEFFFPGFSILTAAVSKYLKIDLNLYIPLMVMLGAFTFAWNYFSEYFWNSLEAHFMSTVDIRTDDEIYNILMSWVAAQKFAQSSRRFVVNTNLNSRSWYLWRWNDEDEDEGDETTADAAGKKRKSLSYTPAFGSHYFWYKGTLLLFRRSQNREQASFLVVSEREEISISCFGRNPWVLKELLYDARQEYATKDEQKTLIYRGATRSGSTEPTWQRSMARTSRPLSTVILSDKVKQDLLDDVTDYLSPSTRRWYSNRGIPYRRGYLLYGPPGTGKSSLSLALAGHFKMRIYIVSLSSVTANEENLASLFAELPRRCVVLLEDIDTAGLTHTRDNGENNAAAANNSSGGENKDDDMVPGQVTTGNGATTTQQTGRLSLSGLLNILDGVASQEGRLLFMTTNHVEKLDKALIRPGRVDMTVKFDNADGDMTRAIFRAIFATLEGDNEPVSAGARDVAVAEKVGHLPTPEEKAKLEAEEAKKRADEEARVIRLADEFVARVPAHEFSPAEIQGFLLKNKRDPEGVVAKAEAWVVEMRKEKKEKELKDAEDKRKKEEEDKKKKAEEEEKKKKEEDEEKKKKKEDEEKEEKKKAKKEKRRKHRKSKKSKSDSDSSGSDSSSDSGSESEAEAKEKTKKGKKGAQPAAVEETKKDAEASVAKAPEVVVTDEAKVVATPVVTAAPAAAVEAKELKVEVEALSEERKHGGDSGYGTP